MAFLIWDLTTVLTLTLPYAACAAPAASSE